MIKDSRIQPSPVRATATTTVPKTPPKLVTTTTVDTQDASLTKRRPLIISQESAEASPAPEIDFHRLKPSVLPAIPSSNENGIESNDDPEDKQIRKGIFDEIHVWLNDVLEVPANQADMLLPQPGLDDEEGITRIVRSTLRLERLLWYGVGLCLDQILTCLTILPLRILFRFARHRKVLSDAHAVFDLACFTLLVLAVLFLAHFVGAAQVYHSIRLQTFMKLYVVVNIAEVLDRLLSSLGLDLFELLAETSVPGRNWASFAIRYVLCLAYTCLHAMLFYVRLLTLSVAVNSSNDALFTILVSNNFVELKGSVFKRSTEQNLFQISCSDVVERFVLIIFMFLVGLNEYETIKGDASRAEFFGLMCLVLLVELLVDWIKHMFIVRFNSDIRVKDVYDRFLGILADDYRGRSTVVDETRTRNVFPAVPKRLGLPIIPIATIIVRVVIFDVSDVIHERSWFFVFTCWLGCLVCKLVLKQVFRQWTGAIATEAAATNSDDEDKSPASTPVAPVATPTKLTLVVEDKTPKAMATATPITINEAPLAKKLSQQFLTSLAKTTPKTSGKKTPAKVLSKVNRFENG